MGQAFRALIEQDLYHTIRSFHLIQEELLVRLGDRASVRWLRVFFVHHFRSVLPIPPSFNPAPSADRRVLLEAHVNCFRFRSTTIVLAFRVANLVEFLLNLVE